jgi:glycosyltransferase involved in cell wall biosynthesis
VKFSIVTPVYNADRWIRETIENTLSQRGDFEIEYIIRDGQSTDTTLNIIEEYAERLNNGTYPIACKGVTLRWASEQDGSMYSAINKGFAEATGDVYAWINADDRYEPEAFQNIQRALEAYPNIQWIKGVTHTIDERGLIIRQGVGHAYYQDWLQKGIYGQEAYFVEQDSIFWKASLWSKIREIPSQLRFAGDYWLWMQFAKYAPLWTFAVPVSSFRKRQGQLSRDIERYKAEQLIIRPRRSATAWRSRCFFGVQAMVTGWIPELEAIFSKLYPLYFWRKYEYLAYEHGRIIKKSTSLSTTR